MIPRKFSDLLSAVVNRRNECERLEYFGDSIKSLAVATIGAESKIALQFVERYLKEETDNEAVVEIRDFIAAPERDFELLDTVYPRSTGQAFQTMLVQITQTALDIRAPLGKQPLAKAGLKELHDGVKAELGSVWQDSRNPAEGLFAVYEGILDGGPVTFVSMCRQIEALDNFVDSVTGYGGPPVGHSDEQIKAGMQRIVNFKRSICEQAEAPERFSVPLPVLPSADGRPVPPTLTL